jgi:hypothetical protein
MYAYDKAAVLMLALVLACIEPAAGKSGSSSSAASSGAKGAGRLAPGGRAASTSAGSTKRTGGGMHGTFRRAPELDPKRKISEQDCAKPMVRDTANLRCK